MIARPQTRLAARNRRVQHGFTLVEVLVVLTIIALLSSLLVTTTAKARRAAQVTQALSGIRQCGAFLLAEAGENEGKLKVHVWGTTSPVARDYMLVNIVRRHMASSSHAEVQLSRIIRTPAWHIPPSGSLSTWTAWGINFENDPANGVVWTTERLPGSDSQNLNVLRVYQVINPAVFALLGDSSDVNGTPHLRLSRVNRDGRSFAMRYNRQGPIFTLDGAAKMIGVEQMPVYALQTGYVFRPNNPATHPELVTAY